MMANKKSKQSLLPWVVVAFACIAVVAIVATALLWKQDKDINSFQACKDAGGAIMESYPEQCAINGKTFTNDAQSVDKPAGEYVGLTEQAALDKAAAENRPARVVERDGESLPITLDLVPGRLNFFVKDGKVYKVQVESEEN